MDYIFGTLCILKNKFWNLDLFKNTLRIKSKMSLYRKYKFFYSGSSQIINNLYLGSSFNAYSNSEISNNKINVIINVTEEIDNYHKDNLSIVYYKFPIKDNGIEDISDILEQSYDIIDKHLSNGDRILVHCFMGASRSASVIIYYLMRKYNISYNKSLQHVYNKREIVNLSQKFDTILNQTTFTHYNN